MSNENDIEYLTKVIKTSNGFSCVDDITELIELTYNGSPHVTTKLNYDIFDVEKYNEDYYTIYEYYKLELHKNEKIAEAIKIKEKNENILKFYNVKDTNFYLNIIKFNDFNTCWLFPFIDPEYQTYDIVKFVVSRKGLLLKYVKDELKTGDICLIAYSNNCCSIKYFPEQFKTKNVIKNSVGKYGFLLEFVPLKFITNDLCFSAIREFSDNIKYIPEKYITQELCNRAMAVLSTLIKYNIIIDVFKYIPDKYKSIDIYKLGIYTEQISFDDIPTDILSKDFIIDCFVKNLNIMFNQKNHNHLIKYLTLDICNSLYNNLHCGDNPKLYEFIPEKFKNYNYYFNAIKNNYISFDKVPKNILSKTFINDLLIIKINAYNFYDITNDTLYSYCKIDTIPTEYFDEDLYIFMLSNEIKIDLPIKFKSFKNLLLINNLSVVDIPIEVENIDTLYSIILSTKPNEIQNIPINLLSNKLCMISVSKDISNLQYIPIEFQTKELCKFAFQINTQEAFKYIKINIYELFDIFSEKEIDKCPICDSNKEYFISYECNHLICTDCIKECENCYYNCNNSKINFNECFKNLNYQINLN